MGYRRSRRISDAQRRATEDAYLTSLRQQRHQVAMLVKEKSDRNFRRLLGCLIVIVVILASMILTGLFVPGSTTTTPTDPPAYSTQTDNPTDPSFTSPNTTYPGGNGFTVECRDGSSSHAGGKRGACSHHGGESRP